MPKQPSWCLSRGMWRAFCLQAIVDHAINELEGDNYELAITYISDAESNNTSGESFWLQFATEAEAAEAFGEYLNRVLGGGDDDPQT